MNSNMKNRFLHLLLLSFLLTNVFIVQHQLCEHEGESCPICLQAELHASVLPNELDGEQLQLLPHRLLNSYCHLAIYSLNPFIEPIRGSPASLA